MKLRPWILWACIALIAAVGAAVPASVGTRELDTPARVRQIVARVHDQPRLERVWAAVVDLEDLGTEALPPIREASKDPDPKVKLVCAKALLTLGQRDDAYILLRGLVAEDYPTEVRIAAIRMLQGAGDPGLAARLVGVLKGTQDPFLRIAACRTLWDIRRSITDPALARQATSDSVRALRELLDSQDRDVQSDAAFALGEIGYLVAEPRVKRILASLANEPTSRGSRARLILEIERLAREREASANPFDLSAKEALEAKEAEIRKLQQEIDDLRDIAGKTGTAGHPLLSSIVELVRAFYVEPDKIDLNRLYVEAAKGFVESIDPFSSYMDPEETRSFEESISGEYGGIGAHVQLDRAGYLLILKPIYGAPAYDAGLRSRDRILEVEGVLTKGKRLEEIVKYLKGKPGTQVRVKVYRRGWPKPREFQIDRKLVQLPSVLHRLLPGNVGYIQLRQFGEGSAIDMERAMRDLEGRARGFILDLRENPGGLLNIAVRIVDMFVGADPRPIVVQKGREDGLPIQRQNATEEEPQWIQIPLVILVDGMSASAAEIVAGALQDYGRATIVGKRTFGKGSVQRLFDLEPRASLDRLLGGPSKLRLTVQYYYLPSGRSIHAERDASGRVLPGKEGGIVPDIEVAQSILPLWKLEELSALIESGDLNAYADKLCKDNLALARSLFDEGDGYQTSRYPGFDAFFQGLKTHLEPDDVRIAVRDAIRRRLQDVEGREIPCDFQEDDQLERGILALLSRMGKDPASIPSYAPFASKTFRANEDDESLEMEPEVVPIPPE
ncbi:MAG: HEAT repeat domain-containing protein [Planctomycetes bacterium]|nr:HEAT repeat domain-containing protein [Planctomycetota bacterium]